MAGIRGMCEEQRTGCPPVSVEALSCYTFNPMNSRLPTPEGLAPLTPSSLDTHLTDLINTFTLRGVPVLIHCRGGVGRAGVVACCWLIKLGLCGWVEPDGKAMPCTAPSGHLDFVTPVRKDTVRFVEKIITVVRKRRSMKAVETYEQVSFLVDFVEYLRRRTGDGAVIHS
jgi:protein-tyrosine phosphatase